MPAKKNKYLKNLFYTFAYYLGCPLAGILLRLLRMTLRSHNLGNDIAELAMREQGKIIYVFWHQDFPSISMFGYKEIRRHRPVFVMVSQSRDGDLLTRALSWFDINAIRGSSTRGGTQALKDMIEILNKDCNAAIALDGPRGPRHEIQPGIFLLAKKTGAAIVPISWNYQAAWRFRSWDRTRLPKPFSEVVSTHHGPLLIPPDATREDFLRVAEEIKICLGLD